MSIFSGTAQYYDLYRPSIPLELVDRIVGAVKDSAAQPHLLDLGSGTGKVLERFLPHFTDIIAVEPESEMMALAKRRLVPHMAADTSIHFVTGKAEEIAVSDEWHASLVTICRAFHWMDREIVLKKLEKIVAPEGAVAIFGDASIWNLEEPWCVVVKGIIQEILGQERKTGEGIFTPPAPYNELLQKSAFSKIEEFTFPVERTWTLDQLLGYIYSYSFSAKGLFGDYVDEFEKAVQQRLEPLAQNGIFKEPNEFKVIIATRP